MMVGRENKHSNKKKLIDPENLWLKTNSVCVCDVYAQGIQDSALTTVLLFL